MKCQNRWKQEFILVFPTHCTQRQLFSRLWVSLSYNAYRQNPWALTSNTVVMEMQTLITISLTEKCDLPHQSYQHWVTDVWVSVKSSKPYKNIRLPYVGITDEVNYFSVRDIVIRCKRNVCMSTTTVLEVSAQRFRRGFVCMHYTIVRLRDDWKIGVECNALGKLR